MESLGYVMLYFCRGSLPWHGLKTGHEVFLKKRSTSTQDLCQGLPCEFASYIDYTRSLGFDEQPDYAKLRGLFSEALVRARVYHDCVWDWDIKKFLVPKHEW